MSRRRKKKKFLLFVVLVAIGGYIGLGSISSDDPKDLDPMGANVTIKNVKSEEIGPEDIKPVIEIGPQSSTLPFKFIFKEPKGYDFKAVSIKMQADNKIYLTPEAKRCFFCKAKKFTVEGEINNLVEGEYKLTTNYGGGL